MLITLLQFRRLFPSLLDPTYWEHQRAAWLLSQRSLSVVHSLFRAAGVFLLPFFFLLFRFIGRFL